MGLSERILEAKRVLQSETDAEFPKRLEPTGFYVSELKDPNVEHQESFFFEGKRYKIGHRIKKNV
jgi:hypothetical protein